MTGFDLSLVSWAGEAVFDPWRNQLADPMAFLRELVQNAIDAGSPRVDISCTFESKSYGTSSLPEGVPDTELGTAVIRIADAGAGMDRSIIENRLTRLFRAVPDSDPAKLGRVGIGFSSVFAIAPDAVCVDTGREGESWRLVFRPDRTFTTVRLSERIEGTIIRLFKTMAPKDFPALEQRVRRGLQQHCPHILEVALRYQGKEAGSPLNLASLDAPIKLAVFEQEATIVVGFTRDGAADSASFYSRGLTLLVRPSELLGVSYKVDSPRIEPTLSRDAIVPSQAYDQILGAVRRLAGGPLVDELSQRLDESLRQAQAEDVLAGLQRRLAGLIRMRIDLPAACAGRLVACSPHGHPFTLLQCQKATAEQRMFAAAHPSPLSAAACANGQVVLEDWQGELLQALCQGEPPRLERVLVLPLAMRQTDELQWSVSAPLRTATLALLKAAAAPVSLVELGYLDYPGSGAGALPAVVQNQPFTVSKLSEALPRHEGWSDRAPQRADRLRSTWVLNADHPTLRVLLPLAVREPELAAYSLVKLCLLGGRLAPELDADLLGLAMSRREQRQEAPMTERLVATLTSEAVSDAAELAIESEPARKRIRGSQLPNPLRYVLDLVQAATLSGATHISFKFSAGDMQMSFDGDRLVPDDFDQLDAPRRFNEDARAAEARRFLSAAIRTALQIDPLLIQVESGSAGVELRPGHPDRHSIREEVAGSTRIHLRQRLGFGLFRRYVDHLGGHLTEEVLLQERCQHAHVPIEINGKEISKGHELPQVKFFRTFRTDELSGSLGIAPRPEVKPDHGGVQMSGETALSATLLRLVHNGVWVDTQLPIELLPGFLALAESAAFRLDSLGEHVIQRQEYAAVIRAVTAAQVELLATLCRRFLDSSGLADAAGPSETGVDTEPDTLTEQHLRDLLRGLLLRLGGPGALHLLLGWAHVPIEQFPPDTIAQRSPAWPEQVHDGAALLDVPILPCTMGELVSLRQILADLRLHKSVAYSVYRSGEPAAERKLVLHVSESASESLLRGLFGNFLECRDITVQAAWPPRLRMNSWRRRSYRPSLSGQLLIARAPLSGPGISGEIGVAPQELPRTPWQRSLNQPCTLRLLLITEGSLFLERAVPFPVPNMTVAVTGDFAADSLVAEGLASSPFEAIIDSVWSALPSLMEQLIRVCEKRDTEGESATAAGREDETLAWWACMMRRLLMLTLSAEARQAARSAMGIPEPQSGSEFAGSALRPHPLWSQLRELPLFEAIDGTSLCPIDLERAAARCGCLAVLCPTSKLPPKRLESWALQDQTQLARAVWSEVQLTQTSPPPFILWLDPAERALCDELRQQLSLTELVDAEPWLLAIEGRAAAVSSEHLAPASPAEPRAAPADPLPLPPEEGLLAAVLGELHALTGKNERLLGGSVGWLHLDDREHASAVVWEGQRCIINRLHPAVQLAQRRFAEDSQCARFLASAVYTALCIRLQWVSDGDAEHFHHYLAVRALSAARSRPSCRAASRPVSYLDADERPAAGRAAPFRFDSDEGTRHKLKIDAALEVPQTSESNV